MIARLRYLVPGWLHFVRVGRGYGYPLCCCVRFAVGQRPGRISGQWRTRGLRLLRSGESFIPCGIFHRAHLTPCEIHRRDAIERAR